MAKMPCWIVMFFCVFFLSCPSEKISGRDFRQDMRDFVQGMSRYAKNSKPGFFIIPQNGHELIKKKSEPGRPIDLTYTGAIDGVGREELFYGYDEDDVATPAAVRETMIDYLDAAKSQGIRVLVIDYCSTQSFMTDSYTRNFTHNYISFAADHRELDNIPGFPLIPYHMNTDTIKTLGDAKNFLYLINPGNYETKEDFIEALKGTQYDLVIIDLYFHGTKIINEADVIALKTKNSGDERLVIAYLSIGEAEDYRYYWDPAWNSNPPHWIAAENPAWEGNYKVRYWSEEWQKIIYGNDDSYVKKIIDAGFDGVYLDIIDAYEYFEEH
ncbi:MAG: endo alpha-1,4 polygalactosaminidase [Spirochaetales bacterium]|nr:endo alpha-1,4 polygalactosaminidase [Spirochaetales bacterium]